MRQKQVPRPPTGIAIIGCGYWGMNYVRLFSELADAKLVAVCDTDPDRLAQVARRFPDALVTSKMSRALNAPGVEAVVVATAAQLHYGHVRASLLADKHVLVEKPLATSSSEASKLVALSKETGCILLVGHTFLYNAGLRLVKDYVSGSGLGRIYYIYSRRTNLGPFRDDVNAVWDLASHDIAIFNYLLGSQPVWASAVGSRVLRSQQEDVSFISLGYPGNVIAHVHASWAEPHKAREVVVVGSDQRIVFNDLDPIEQVRVFDRGVRRDEQVDGSGFGEHHFSIRQGSILSPVVPVVEPLKMQAGHFLHCIRRGERPLTGGSVGRDVVVVMEGIDQSILERGAPVEIDRIDTTAHNDDRGGTREAWGGRDARTVR